MINFFKKTIKIFIINFVIIILFLSIIELSFGYWFDKNNFDDLEKINTSLSRFAIDIQQRGLEYYKIKYNKYKIDLADPLAMAAMIDDAETEYKSCNIKMILSGEKRGKDIISFSEGGKVKLASKISRNNFLNTLENSLV